MTDQPITRSDSDRRLPNVIFGGLSSLGRYARLRARRSTAIIHLLMACLFIAIRGGTDGQRMAFRTLVRRMHDMGPQALGLTLQFGISLGLVFGIWLETWLGWIDLLEVAVGEATGVLVEQVAPLFVAIMVAAHSGTGLAADLSSMVAARELDALRSLSLSPERMLAAPAIVSAVLVVPLLTVIMIACILLTFAVYLHLVQLGSVPLIVSVAIRAMEPGAIATALCKAALFGPLIVAIAVSQGLTEQPTTRLVGVGVSSATVRMISTILLLNAAWSLLL